MKVELLTHTPDPQGVVAAAARLCYSDAGISDLMAAGAKGELKGLLKKILDLGHYSVLEHAVFTFGVERISRACSHQLVRHRVASYSQQSQRYVAADASFGRVTPPSIADNPAALEKYESLMTTAGEGYAELLAMGIPAEDARFVLPNAAETKIVLTMNARELRSVFFDERGCNRAQWEIRAMAIEMLRQVKKVAPLLFELCGPSCVRGSCKEGKMTCGRAAEVRAAFNAMG